MRSLATNKLVTNIQIHSKRKRKDKRITKFCVRTRNSPEEYFQSLWSTNTFSSDYVNKQPGE